ncbi:MAG: hypothetical protein WC655_21345 [Candidatus Hydrogenedentales bacterium]|jgi:hypothetical protein
MHPRYVAQGLDRARKTISDGLEVVCRELHIAPAQPVPFERYPELRPLRELEAIAERVQAVADVIAPNASKEPEVPATEVLAEQSSETSGQTEASTGVEPEAAVDVPPVADDVKPVEPPVAVTGAPQAAKQRPGKDLKR